jgi:hypothetical protein
VIVMNNKETPPTTERRCAQIKQIIRLSQCIHTESAQEIVLGINGNWICYCTDCDKVLDRG